MPRSRNIPQDIPAVEAGRCVLEYVGPFLDGVHVQLAPGGDWTSQPVPRGGHFETSAEHAAALLDQVENWKLVAGVPAAPVDETTHAAVVDEAPADAVAGEEPADGAPTAEEA